MRIEYTVQIVVGEIWQKMKKDFPGKDDRAKKVSRKIDAWKSLSYIYEKI